MKQFITLALIAGALMVSSPGQARMVSSRFECVTSCGSAIDETCGWITRRGKFNACKNRLMRQCRRWGTATMCPAPPPPTATPTVPPPPPPTTTTTTTVPFIPPTTTTTLPQLGPWSGVWRFYGTVYQNDCPSGVAPYGLTETFTVEQRGINFTAKVGSVPGLVLVGDIDDDGGFTVVGDWSLPPCNFRSVLATTPTGTVVVSTEPASVGQAAVCPSFSCSTIYVGSMSR